MPFKVYDSRKLCWKLWQIIVKFDIQNVFTIQRIIHFQPDLSEIMINTWELLPAYFINIIQNVWVIYRS
jgi:hypothetical protein